MIDEIVLENAWGGLGDHLFDSAIPRAAKQCSVKKVFISSLAPFRHEDYRAIWTMNPHVDGFVDKPRTPQVDVPFPVDGNLLDYHMLRQGIDDGKRWHEPELYYRPKLRPEWAGLTVYDPNYVSGPAGVGDIDPHRIKDWFIANNVSVDAETVAFFGSRSLWIQNPSAIHTPTFFEYCNLIHSCKAFYCVPSGGATLAPALGKSANVFHGANHAPMFRHSKLNRYIQV